MDAENDKLGLALDRLLENYHRHNKQKLATDCPSAEDLLDYIEGRLGPENVPLVHRHLPFCSGCRDIILSFRQVPDPSQYAFANAEPDGAADTDGTERLGRDGPRQGAVATRRIPLSFLTLWARLYGLLSLKLARPVVSWLSWSGLLCASLAALFWLGLYPSELSRLAYVEEPTSTTHVRSDAVIGVDPYNAYYNQGVTALRRAQFWTLKRVNAPKVVEGIYYLQKARELAEKEENQTYLAECYYHLGKAYLKINNVREAHRQFEAVHGLDGSSQLLLDVKQNATEILNKLDGVAAK